jgi:tRNA A-37 threonylcarbamoyl transferase component Bud32
MIVKRHGARAGRAWLGRRTPGEREYEALAELAAIGLPVPRPLFWSERAGRSAVAMELVEHRETLHGALDRARGAEARALIEELARVVARFHDEGWYHRDLYLQHVVVRTGPAGVGSGPIGPGAANRLCLIDLGRARHAAAPRRRWFVKDLAALLHSAPAGLGRAAQLRFLVRYLRLRGVRGRSEVLGWARAIERKRARMAAHEPRHGEHIPEHEAAERELRG